jgi:hypothetical protein
VVCVTLAVGSVSPLLDGEPIRILDVRAECLVAEPRTKFRKAFVKRAFDGAIAAGQEADRPVGAEDQTILAEAPVLNDWKQTARVPVSFQTAVLLDQAISRRRAVVMA